ncbi:MAG: hypothetical protein AAF492_18975, partial [Verrucomicrobiota bacterium]
MIHDKNAGKTKIIEAVRALHRKRAPLNISAVKRRVPWLLEEAYAVRPFWGWKQVLADAGIAYDEISTDLEEVVVCRICYRPFSNLVPHLLSVHELESSEYLSEFPDSVLYSEAHLARSFAVSKKRKDMPDHWESLWSNEYVLDRLWERHLRGLPMNHAAIYDLEPSLLSQIDRRFGSFEQALERLGLEPDDVRVRKRPSCLQSREEVIEAILARRRSELSLNMRSLLVGNEADTALYKRAQRLFGNWRSAVESAGL